MEDWKAGFKPGLQNECLKLGQPFACLYYGEKAKPLICNVIGVIFQRCENVQLFTWNLHWMYQFVNSERFGVRTTTGHPAG